MKELKKSSIENITPIKLHFDDIKEIIEILKENKPQEINIKTADAELSYDELIKYDQNIINEIHLNSMNPSISVNIGQNNSSEVHIYRSDNSAEAVGTVQKILVILRNKRKLINRILGPYNFYLCIYMIVYTIASISIYIIFRIGNIYIDICAYIIFAILFIISMLPQVKKNQIILSYKKNTPSFWVRKKDDIIVGIIISIISGFIGFILGRI